MQSKSYSFLAQAIAKRLKELPCSVQRADLSFCHVPKGVDSEELLRQVMVVHYPKLQRGDFASLNECLEKLFRLTDSALKDDDLRFFDAFNCVYEVVQDKKQLDEEPWGQFLSCYKAILNVMLVKCKELFSADING